MLPWVSWDEDALLASGGSCTLRGTCRYTDSPKGWKKVELPKEEGPLGRGKGGALADLEFYFPA